MPEPNKAGAGATTDPKSSTPSTTDKPPTHKSDPLMSALQIPEEVQNRIMAADEAKAGNTPATKPATPPADELPPEVTPEGDAVKPTPPEQPTPPPEKETATPQSAAGTDDDEDDDDLPAITPEAESQLPKPAQKLLKRNRRLTRELRTTERELEASEKVRAELEKKIGNGEKPTKATIPSRTGRLAHITNERDLNEAIGRSEAIIDFCDAHPDGEGIAEKDLAPEFKDAIAVGQLTLREAAAKSVAQWKGEAQKVLLSAPNRRDEIRTYNNDRAFYDDLARKAWPDLFDKTSQTYQLAQAILKEKPWVAESPDVNYAIGLVIEGMGSVKSRFTKAQPNGQQQPTRKDISPRAFEERVPIAPSTPEPPSREARTVLANKKVDEARSALIRDPDGSAASLAALLAAEDEAGLGTAPARGRAPVKV